MSKEESKSDVVKWRISTSFGSAPERAVYAGDRYLFQVPDADWPTLNQIVNDHNEVEELKRRNATQEESITHLQSQFRVMKEAIEAEIHRQCAHCKNGIGWNDDRSAHYGYEHQGIVGIVRCLASPVLRAAITPKGSEQKP